MNLRTLQQTHLLDTLRADLDNVNQGLSFYLSQHGNDDYQLWHKSEVLSPATSTDSTPPKKPNILRYHHRHDAYTQAMAELGQASRISEAGWIAMGLRTEFETWPEEDTPAPEFVVLDLTSMPVYEALPLIEGALLPAK